MGVNRLAMHALGCCLLMCKLLIRGFFTLCLLPLDVQAAHQGLLPFACCLRPDAPNKLRCLCVVWYARLRVCMCVSTRTRACACVHVCVCEQSCTCVCLSVSSCPCSPLPWLCTCRPGRAGGRG